MQKLWNEKRKKKKEMNEKRKIFLMSNHTVFLYRFGINLHGLVQFQLFEKLARANYSKLNEKNCIYLY